VQAVLGLIEHRALRTIDHLVGDPLRRDAPEVVQDDRHRASRVRGSAALSWNPWNARRRRSYSCSWPMLVHDIVYTTSAPLTAVTGSLPSVI